jgi:hypothetical protein
VVLFSTPLFRWVASRHRCPVKPLYAEKPLNFQFCLSPIWSLRTASRPSIHADSIHTKASRFSKPTVTHSCFLYFLGFFGIYSCTGPISREDRHARARQRSGIPRGTRQDDELSLQNPCTPLALAESHEIGYLVNSGVWFFHPFPFALSKQWHPALLSSELQTSSQTAGMLECACLC